MVQLVMTWRMHKFMSNLFTWKICFNRFELVDTELLKKGVFKCDQDFMKTIQSRTKLFSIWEGREKGREGMN